MIIISSVELLVRKLWLLGQQDGMHKSLNLLSIAWLGITMKLMNEGKGRTRHRFLHTIIFNYR